jgi:hypothetical protein
MGSTNQASHLTTQRPKAASNGAWTGAERRSKRPSPPSFKCTHEAPLTTVSFLFLYYKNTLYRYIHSEYPIA